MIVHRSGPEYTGRTHRTPTGTALGGGRDGDGLEGADGRHRDE